MARGASQQAPERHLPLDGERQTGRPQPPLTDLWARSLKPLIEQYLAGSDIRDAELDHLEKVFLSLWTD